MMDMPQYTYQEITANALVQKQEVIVHDSNDIRRQAIKEAADELGVQTGLAWGNKQIVQTLNEIGDTLDHIYNFNAIMLPDYVLPPVLQEVTDILNQQKSDEIYFADKQYHIIAQAQFVTRAPTWRDYIMPQKVKIQMPEKIMLPRDDEETSYWNECVKNAWLEGVEQSQSIFNMGLKRLQRDYTGMLLYQQMLMRHMISLPFVTKSISALSSSSKDDMTLGNASWHIDTMPAFNADMSKWRTIIDK